MKVCWLGEELSADYADYTGSDRSQPGLSFLWLLYRSICR